MFSPNSGNRGDSQSLTSTRMQIKSGELNDSISTRLERLSLRRDFKVHGTTCVGGDS